MLMLLTILIEWTLFGHSAPREFGQGDSKNRTDHHFKIQLQRSSENQA